MKSLLKPLASATLLCFVVIMLPAPAGSRDANIKQLMGENFGTTQKILVKLIRGDYATLPHDVEVIYGHAGELRGLVPVSAKADQDLFLSMVYSLQIHAKHLKTIVEILIQHDRNSGNGLMKIDYLRNSAAAHFGQMVTTCVACHNQFRRQVVN